MGGGRLGGMWYACPLQLNPTALKQREWELHKHTSSSELPDRKGELLDRKGELPDRKGELPDRKGELPGGMGELSARSVCTAG